MHFWLLLLFWKYCTNQLLWADTVPVRLIPVHSARSRFLTITALYKFTYLLTQTADCITYDRYADCCYQLSSWLTWLLQGPQSHEVQGVSWPPTFSSTWSTCSVWPPLFISYSDFDPHFSLPSAASGLLHYKLIIYTTTMHLTSNGSDQFVHKMKTSGSLRVTIR